ncbi:innexin inx2-like [Centruroides vittatus]|uniref:innexin inx2-like n=1 Tax=Centruroides vittatus TaxID=120091 RepID=UPI00350F8152
MDKILGSLKGILKIKSTNIDNRVFCLHYKYTVVILLAFSILVTSKQYIGDPIDCISRDDIPSKLLDSFCWIHGTFSVVDAWEKKVGEEVPYPGVDKYVKGQQKVYHTYYQWVCFVLFLQALLFYIPRYLWKIWEGGRIKSILLELNAPIMEAEKKTKRREILVEYLMANMDQHGVYVLQFFLCEVLALINVIGQMCLMDKFLGGEFTSYGTKVLQFTEWDHSVRYDPMIRVFPRLTKCTFHRYGSSGDVQRHDAMCILPVNIVNEKIYVFLWFWFIIITTLSCYILIYHIVLYFMPYFRYIVLKGKARMSSSQHIDIIAQKCKMGDWFIIELLAKNMDPINFRDLVADLAKKIERKSAEIV